MKTSKIKKDSVAAKMKIVTHLEKYRNDNFEVTDNKVLYWWKIINKAAFNNRLDQPLIVIRKLRGAWGICDVKGRENNLTITVNESINSRDLFISTIAHEMVHQWQWKKNQNMHHSYNFIKWKRYFKKHYGIVI